MGEQIYNAFNSDWKTAASMIVGLVIWISRAFAALLVIWGAFGIVTARKEGEGSELTAAITKLTLGLMILSMVPILKAVGVLV